MIDDAILLMITLIIHHSLSVWSYYSHIEISWDRFCPWPVYIVDTVCLYILFTDTLDTNEVL